MNRSNYRLAVLATLSLLFLNCDDWHVWDDVFERVPAWGTVGWTGGDGAFSTALRDNKALWAFGDSELSGVDWLGNRVVPPNLGYIFRSVFGNTIGIQSTVSNPNPTNIQFYARNGGNVANITETTDNASQFFDYAMLNLTPPPGTWGLWPSGLHCLDCTDSDDTNDKLIIAFAEAVGCDPSKDTSCSLPLCPVDMTTCTLEQGTCKTDCPPDPECELGVKIASTVIALVTNTDSSNPGIKEDNRHLWTVSSSARVRIETDVLWGTTFMPDGDHIYIYGGENAFQTKLYVARATVSTLLSPLNWEYRVGGEWVNGSTIGDLPFSDELDVAATGSGAYPSVSKITRRNQTRYVLVNDHVFDDHFLFVRTSQNQYEWSDIDSKTVKVDLAAMDSSIQWVQLLRFLAGPSLYPTCRYCLHNGEYDWRACGMTYHGHAHPSISTGIDSHGMTSLYFSYIVPQGPDHTDPRLSLKYYRPKFGSIDLDTIEPWCTAAGRTCWEGIGRLYNTRDLTPGVPLTLSYDVSKAAALGTKFYASIIFGTGNPDLYVKFGSQPTLWSYDCKSNSFGVIEHCELEVPEDEITAYVMVRAATTSKFTLRVVYAGD